MGTSNHKQQILLVGLLIWATYSLFASVESARTGAEVWGVHRAALESAGHGLLALGEGQLTPDLIWLPVALGPFAIVGAVGWYALRD